MSIISVYILVFIAGKYVVVSNKDIYVGDVYNYDGYDTVSEIVHNYMQYYKNNSFHNGIENFVNYYHKYTQECVL